MAANELPTLNDLKRLRVVDLKEKLTELQLSTSGLKADLVNRLYESYQQSVYQTDNNESEELQEDRNEDEEESERITMEEEKQVAEEAEQLRIQEEDKKKAEEAERLRLEEERKEAEEAEKIRLEEKRKKAEEAEKIRLEEERREAEEAERIRLEEERKKAEEAERIRLEEEKRKAEEAERLRLEEERKKAEEAERKRLEEERKKAEEAERKRLEEDRKKAEVAERKRLEEERKKAEEAERIRLEEEKRRAEEAERIRLEEERKKAEEAKRMRKEEEERKKAEEVERKRLAEEKRKAQEAERKRQQEEQRKKAEEAERKRKMAEEAERRRQQEEQRKKAEEAERKRKEEQRKKAEEAERKRQQEEQRKKAEEAERKRKQEEQRKRAEEAERKRKQEEQRKRAEEAERKRKQEEQRKAEEADKKRKQEEQKKKAEEAERIKLQEEKRKAQQSTLGPQGMSTQPALPRIEAAAGPQRISGLPSSLISSDGLKAEDNGTNESIELPQALEKALAFKSERAQQVGVNPEDVDNMDVSRDVDADGEDEDDSVDLLLGSAKPTGDKSDSKNQKESKNKRKKKKKRRARTVLNNQMEESKDTKNDSQEKEEQVDIEYVQEVLDITNPFYFQFTKIFDKFKLDEPTTEGANNAANEKEDHRNPDLKKKGPPSSGEDSDIEEQNKDENKPKLSKRKQKLSSRLSVAQLKQRVSRPDLVEMHDVTAKDPEILLALKATRNSVPVPRHWCFKRKYLQGKRGIEKPPFDLPHFIKKTGIMEMRQALAEKEDQKTLKAKMRERVRPKMGKIDIDYQKLHDAFFKWQTKPKMTIHGDLYYEGKEFETKMKDKKPGDLSDELRTALGMPVGPSCQKVPPPWLIAMQRYGPPPSYPNLKIPGLNAPIPDGCSFGYHAGGWGKPPVDEMGRPLYGDVFGIQNSDYQNQLLEEEIDKTQWGELESESSESSEEEEDEEEEEEEGEEKEVDQTGLVTPADGGLITPSGITSIPAGMETPDMIELRKRKIEADMEGGDTPALYTILPEKKSEKVGNAMMGSAHVYDMSAAISKKATPGAVNLDKDRVGVEVALDPSELDMDTAAMAARYEQTVREQKESQLAKEDLSDMVAEHAAKQKSKRKKAQQDSGKAAKRYKEFKF